MEESTVQIDDTNTNGRWAENVKSETDARKSISLSNVNVVVDEIASEMFADKVQSLADLAYAKLNEQPQQIVSTDAKETMQAMCPDNVFTYEATGNPYIDSRDNTLYSQQDFSQHHQSLSSSFMYDQNYDPQMANPFYVYPYQMVAPSYSDVPGEGTELDQCTYEEVDLSYGLLNETAGSTVSATPSRPLWYQCIDHEGRPSTAYNVNAPVFYPSTYTQNTIPETDSDSVDFTTSPEYLQSIADINYQTEITNNTTEVQNPQIRYHESYKNDSISENEYSETYTSDRDDKRTSRLSPVKFGAVELGRTCYENTQFQYPSIYVSDSGLITLLLKNDVSMEMTVDMAIRLVSHQSQLVVATNNNGTATFLSHPIAKIAQDTESIEADIFQGRKAKLTNECVTFANESECFVFDNEMIDFECDLELTNLAKDNSIEYLFRSAKLGPEVVPQCVSLISQAEYRLLNRGGFVVKINGMKITQTGRGDVSVLCGPKYLRISPGKKQLTVQTRTVDISIASNSVIEINKECLSLYADQVEMQLSNEGIEAGFDPENNAYASSLPDMRSLPIGRRRQHVRTPINRLRQRRRNLSKECNFD